MTAARLKTELVQIRLTPMEKEKLRLLAEKNQMTISEFLRHIIYRELNSTK